MKKLIISLLFGVVSQFVIAAPTQCPQHFVAGQAPTITNKTMTNQALDLCYLGFAVVNSGLTRGPLYSAEHLTRDRIIQAQALKRVDSFHAETAIPANQRGELSDYVRSGYDRGHMAPNKDMSDSEMQYQSFSLANIVPQDPDNNRNLHADIENATRVMAKKYGEVYVITGPAFMGSTWQKIGNVAVPTNIWKAVYVPSLNIAGVYWEKNAPGYEYEIITVNELSARVGMDIFPGLPANIKTQKVDMPRPVAASSYRE
jgi:endonuclease G